MGLYLTRCRKYIGGWKTGQRNDEKDTRGLSDIAIRHEAQIDARPQALKNRRRIRWTTVRMFRG
jgi:hypothetical protein